MKRISADEFSVVFILGLLLSSLLFSACAVVIAVLAMPSASPASDRPHEWVVSLTGVEGVTVFAPTQQLRQRWRVPLPVLYLSEGSSTVGAGLVCDGRTRGTAHLFGDEMLAVWFYSGVRCENDCFRRMASASSAKREIRMLVTRLELRFSLQDPH